MGVGGCTGAGVCLRACSLNYSACNVHAPLSSPSSLAPPHFSTSSHKRHDFRGEKKLLNIKFIFWFSLQLLCETFLTVRGIEWDIVINVKTSSCYSCRILMELESFLNIFSKRSSDIKFYQNPYSDSRVVSSRTARRTDRRDEANSRFSQFCERAWKLTPVVAICEL
jgi:hypothetical protein